MFITRRNFINPDQKRAVTLSGSVAESKGLQKIARDPSALLRSGRYDREASTLYSRLGRLCVIVLCQLWLVLSALPSYATTIEEVEGGKDLRAWLIQENALPVVVIQLTFKQGGAAYDPKDKQGLANMASDLLMEGAGDLDATAFKRKLDDYAIRMDVDIDEDYLHVQIKTLKEHLDTAVDMLNLVLTSPRFEDQAIERNRRQIEVSIAKNMENPTYLADQAFKKKIYGDHPYGYFPLGTKESVQTITKEDLQHYAAQAITRNNLVVSVVGDIDVDGVKKLLGHFEALPVREAAIPEITKAVWPENSETTFLDKKVPQSIALFGIEALPRTDPDFYPAFILNHILGAGGFESRLMNEVREKRGLAYTVYTSLELLRSASLFKGYVATKNSKINDSLSLIKEEFSHMRESGVTAEELQKAKDYLMGSFALNLDKNEKLASFISFMQLDNLGKDFLEKRNSYVEAVTLEQVNAVAKRLLDPNKLVIVVVGNQSEITKNAVPAHN